VDDGELGQSVEVGHRLFGTPVFGITDASQSASSSMVSLASRAAAMGSSAGSSSRGKIPSPAPMPAMKMAK
jgi:hypothetical protein